MKIRRMAAALSLAACLLAVPSAALAAPVLAPLADDTVIFGQSFTLAAGEVTDNLLVFGGDVVVEEGATVLRSLVVFGGNVEVHGAVGESVVVVGGNILLASSAVVHEDLVSFGGRVTRQPGAQVLGQQTSEEQLPAPAPVRPSQGGWFGRQVLRVFQLAGLLGVAFVLALLTPRQLAQTANTIASRGVIAGGLGAISYVLLPLAVLITLITCLLPPLLILLVLFGSIFGWVALGLQLGRRITEMLRVSWSFELQVLAGTLVLSVVTFVVGSVPCIGWLGGFALGSIGLGATLLSRFGTQPAWGAAEPAPALPAAQASPARTPAARTTQASPAGRKATGKPAPPAAPKPRKPRRPANSE